MCDCITGIETSCDEENSDNENKCLFKKVNLCLWNIGHLSVKQKRCLFKKLRLKYFKIYIKPYIKFMSDKVV